MIMNFINVMIARSTFTAEGEKRMTCCLCTNVLLQDRGRRKNFMKRAVILQGTCCRIYVQIHSTVLVFGKIRMLLCGSLCENQLMENLKEEVGRKISNVLKEEDERSKPESPKESSPT